MPTIGTTTRPAYVYDAETDTWIPVGTGPHTHTGFAISDVTGLQAALDAEVSVANYFVAGKNKIINGDFAINQRNFTSTSTNGTYGFDRWKVTAVGGTTTYSSQSFTAGAAPVAGYESRNFARIVTSGQSGSGDWSSLDQLIEDVRTLAGQTVTLSFWAKAGSGSPKVAVFATQNFGTGGSPSSNTDTYFGQVTLSTSWTRYSITATLPSLSGKTIGTTTPGYVVPFLMVSAGSAYNGLTGSLGLQANTFDFSNVMLEAGSVMTPFTTATGSIQGEQAACQRYYVRFNADDSSLAMFNFKGHFYSASNWFGYFDFPVVMRTAPQAVEYSAVGNLLLDDLSASYAMTGIATNTARNTKRLGYIYGSAAGGTAFRPAYLFANSTQAAYIGWSAEL